MKTIIDDGFRKKAADVCTGPAEQPAPTPASSSTP